MYKFLFGPVPSRRLRMSLGDVLSFITKSKPGLPAAVLTNGTLFADPDIRNAVMGADVILPSPDAATEKGFSSAEHPGQTGHRFGPASRIGRGASADYRSLGTGGGSKDNEGQAGAGGFYQLPEV